ncbi:hypothetical protein L2E82_06198 [Cichorium intybus]|uniref:Uncharacterized protein n=1 Tax=Cichorium intybus TaxID=13427 RepID=A0ACB9H8X7_CICIN|nr:hypothetical protein L2E82_06198 [Cichorium intybus]
MKSLIPIWKVSVLGGVLAWIVVSSMFNATQIIRSLTQPWVSSGVIFRIPIILEIKLSDILRSRNNILTSSRICGIYDRA